MTPESRRRRLYRRLRQKSGKNTRFQDMQTALEQHGFQFHRISRSSHYLYKYPDRAGFLTLIRDHPGNEVADYSGRKALDAIQEVAGYED